MKIQKHRLGYCLLMITIFFGLSGCVYLRLLRLKKQFQQFERYVLIDNTYGLSMTFKEPILLEQDIVWLLKGKPAIKARSGRDSLFKYDFKKTYPDELLLETDLAQIALFFFFQDGKLYRVRFPKAFSRYIEPELLTGSLRSVGSGTVDKQQKSISATFPTNQHTTTRIIPSRSEVEHILGTPYRLIETPSATRLLYQYDIQIRSQQHQTTFPIVRLWLSFSSVDDKIISAKASFNGMVTSMNF